MQTRLSVARRKATKAVSIRRHPKTKEYNVYVGSGKGETVRLALLSSFKNMDKEAKEQVHAIREAIAGLIAGHQAYKPK